MESTDFSQEEITFHISKFRAEEIALVNFILLNSDQILKNTIFTVDYKEFQSFLISELKDGDLSYMENFDSYYIDGTINDLYFNNLGDYRFITNRIFAENPVLSLSSFFVEFIKSSKGLQITYTKSGTKAAKHQLSDLYRDDFHGWIMENVGYLKTHRFDKLDLNNLIDEFLCLGRGIESILEWRTDILIYRLMVWSRGIFPTWENLFSIDFQRDEIFDILDENKSLNFKFNNKILYRAWSHARSRAAFELNVKKEKIQDFPEWDFDVLMNPQNHPEIFPVDDLVSSILKEHPFKTIHL